MRYLFVLTYYRPHWTGLTQYAARLAEGLAKNNPVTVLCSQHDKKLLPKEEIAGVRVVRVSYWFRMLRSVIMPGFLPTMIRLLREADTVVVYLPLQEVILVTPICRLLGKKVFLVHNGDLVLPNESGWKGRLVEKIYRLTTGLSIRLSNGVLIQSKDYAKNSKLLSPLEDKWRVVLPLFEKMIVDRKKVADFKKRNSLTDKVAIGYSGRFVEEKGVDFLLKSIPWLVKEIPNAVLVMAGDYKIKYENFWEKIRMLIDRYKDRVRLLGLINNRDELLAFYGSLDVYVQPSRTDCFPSSQIEAVLCGTPSVCTNIPGARWVVENTKMGMIVPPADPKKMAAAIARVYKDRDKYVKYRGKAKKIFDYQQTLEEYEKVFRKD